MTMTAEDRREARQYAWQYFSLHADQRLKLFNFFLVLSGLLIGALPAVKQLAPNTKLVIALPLIQTFSAFIFWRLDVRTRMLIRNAENAIKYLDGTWGLEASQSGEPHPISLFARDDFHVKKLEGNWWATHIIPMSYTDAFRLTYLVIGALGILLAVWEVAR